MRNDATNPDPCLRRGDGVTADEELSQTDPGRHAAPAKRCSARGAPGPGHAHCVADPSARRHAPAMWATAGQWCRRMRCAHAHGPSSGQTWAGLAPRLERGTARVRARFARSWDWIFRRGRRRPVRNGEPPALSGFLPRWPVGRCRGPMRRASVAARDRAAPARCSTDSRDRGGRDSRMLDGREARASGQDVASDSTGQGCPPAACHLPSWRPVMAGMRRAACPGDARKGPIAHQVAPRVAAALG